MEIQIHANDSDSGHSHKLFLTSRNGRPVNDHVQPFEGDLVETQVMNMGVITSNEVRNIKLHLVR